MPTIHPEAGVSRESLLKAIEQLSPQDLDQLAVEVQNLKNRRGRSRLTAAESYLMGRINVGLPASFRDRFDQLVVRRRDEVLTAEEFDELLRLTAQLEEIEASRVESLTELARLRGVALAALMAELGIPANGHG